MFISERFKVAWSATGSSISGAAILPIKRGLAPILAKFSSLCNDMLPVTPLCGLVADARSYSGLIVCCACFFSVVKAPSALPWLKDGLFVSLVAFLKGILASVKHDL